MSRRTIDDIARIAGVSKSTVSRVINDHPMVKPEVRRRVQAVIQAEEFRPHAIARALASHKTGILGFVLPEHFARYHPDPWFALILRAVLNACEAQGRSLNVLLGDATNAANAARIVERLDSLRYLDGVISLGNGEPDELTRRLDAISHPHVIIGTTTGELGTSIDADQHEGGRRATQYLIDRGASRIAMISGPQSELNHIGRMNGYLAALNDAGLEPPCDPIETGYSIASAREAAEKLLQMSPSPDAVLFASDWLAYEFIHVANGLAAPTPLLASFDDFENDLNDRLGLSSYRWPIDLVAYRAVDMLVNGSMDSAASERREIIASEFVVRPDPLNTLALVPDRSGARYEGGTGTES